MILVYLCCGLPLVLLGVGLYLILRAVRSFSRRERTSHLQRFYEKLQSEYPDANREQLVRRVIRREAVRGGMVGILTGFGGFLTLLIALPVDLFFTSRIQSELIRFIAALYGQEVSAGIEVERYLLLTGGKPLTRVSHRRLLNLGVLALEEIGTRLIPGVGAALSAASNYYFIRLAGEMALERYSEQSLA
jgi:hypothetical protein